MLSIYSFPCEGWKKIQAMRMEPAFIIPPGPKKVSNLWKASLVIISDCSQRLWCRFKSRRWVMGLSMKVVIPT